MSIRALGNFGKHPCRECGWRFAVVRGICRTCAIANPALLRELQRRQAINTERRRQARRDAAAAKAANHEPLERIVYVDKPPREVVINRHVYWVVYDGSGRVG